jgi:hypothetical protein
LKGGYSIRHNFKNKEIGLLKKKAGVIIENEYEDLKPRCLSKNGKGLLESIGRRGGE